MRELGPGEVIGELALLTGEPRSAGVRAMRDSTVLEIPRGAFEDVLAVVVGVRLANGGLDLRTALVVR